MSIGSEYSAFTLCCGNTHNCVDASLSVAVSRSLLCTEHVFGDCTQESAAHHFSVSYPDNTQPYSNNLNYLHCYGGLI